MLSLILSVALSQVTLDLPPRKDGGVAAAPAPQTVSEDPYAERRMELVVQLIQLTRRITKELTPKAKLVALVFRVQATPAEDAAIAIWALDGESRLGMYFTFKNGEWKSLDDVFGGAGQ